ncbi:hypothetical protein [Komagataeibacter intermedius]|uniref:Transposase n=1 Tax=Komagataeibacter intermedius NRIC 0521 TaxID=1307934 RepID=A0ABQ0PGM9_9PROT|nr:hypothetical protein [Komagataeibacter intermedius]GAN86361.1 hypothetical protein Gain_0027_036 [Komagataeibacter intermedius TF2]GBQ67972.1 hypothetical protein AA0521_1119 [Komagataeibacter intermedius NRIC 0521]
MIRFLKRHVWPWAEIERLKREVGELRTSHFRILDDLEHYFFAWVTSDERADKLEVRLAKYERPRDESGRFTSND